MASKKNSSKKTQRADRNAKKAKNPSPGARAHRHGGGSGQPQPRVITSPARIDAIRGAMMREMIDYLGKLDIEIPEDSGRENLVKCLCGLSDDDFMLPSLRKWISSDLGYGTLDNIEMAFAHAYRKVGDTAFVDAKMFPGTSLVSFDYNLEILEIRSKAAPQRAVASTVRRPASFGSAEVARRVHAASQQ